MLNIRKRFFLLLTIVGLIVSLASCAKSNKYIEISVFEDEKVIIVGETVELQPTVKKGDSAGTVTLVYASRNDNVATYKDGVLTGVAVGQTEIKVYCKENALAYDTVKVTVIKDKLPEMDFSSLQTSMLKGATQQLECVFNPEEAKADVAFTYSSSNPAVASIDDNGLITAHAVGNTTLTVVAKNLLNVFMEETRTMTFDIVVTESDFTIDYVLNGGTNAANNPVGYSVFNLPIALADSTKVGYTFAGWYDNAELSGDALTEIPANSQRNITLYAKWNLNTYTVTYDLAGGTNDAANPDTYTVEDQLPLTLAAPTLKGYNFLGWYAGEEKVEQLTADTLGNYELTAKWELAQYSISYNLNGGDWALDPSSLYEYNKDRAALVADFVIDFNKHSGKTVAADGSDFFSRSWMADGSSAGYNFLASAEYGAKWAWMLDLINEARIARGKEALKADDGQAEARGEIHNFLMACAPGDKGGNAAYGSDYSTAEAENALWTKLLKIEIVNSYNINSEEVIIPVPVRLGHSFLGWYDENDQLVEKIETGSAGNVKLTAKWEVETYTITYNYNGGLLSIYKYADRAEMVADFIADFNREMNKEFTVESFIAQGAWSVSNESVFMYRPAMLEKWGWIVDYLATTASSANKRAYEVFRNYTDQAGLQSDNSNNIYRFAYELRGFIGGFQYTKNANYKTSDYSQDDLGNGFWNLLVKPDAITPVETYVYTDATIALGTPEKAGNEFLGWYLNGEKVESIDPKLAKDLVLEAKWSHDPIAINYVLGEGTLPEGAAQSFTYADGLETLPTPTKLGYTFLGWYSDEACTEKVESIAKELLEEVTLYASWELTVFQITYELNGGAFIRDEIVDLYDSFDAMAAEFIADYSALTGVTGITAENFYGKSAKYGLYAFFKDEAMAAKWNWLLEYVQAYAAELDYTGKAYLNISAGAANFNKYARSNFAALLQQVMLNNVSPISMNFENVDGEAFWAACPDKTIQVGTESVNEYTIDQLPVTLANPDKKGATFVGWYTNADLKNGKVTEITIDLIGNITLYARWSDSVVAFDTYTITYELDGGELEADAPTSYVEETGVALSKGATKSGYTFKGWFLDAACTQEVKEFTALDKGAKTVYACWEVVNYSITYNAGEGTLPTMMVPEGDYEDWAALVADFVVDFNAFSGKTVAADGSDFFARSWMADGSSAGYNFLTSAEYGAKWGGLLTVINETRIAQGKAALSKDDGQAEARGEVQNLLTKSSAAANVTAGYGSDYTSEEVWGKVWDHFELIHMVEIQVPTTYNVEQLPYTLATPTCPEGLEFAGWYTNAEFTGDAMFELPLGTVGDIELWAKYSSPRHAINYELNEGVLPDNAPDTFVEGEELELVAPTRYGYDFLGWELNGEIVTKIPADIKNDITLIANWELSEYTVEFELDGGAFEATSFEKFVEELIKDFNDLTQSDAASTTAAGFHNSTHPNIKYVFAKAEMLEKYRWLNEFILAELKAQNADRLDGTYMVETIAMIEGMLAGDTTAASGSYANGRTLWRHFVHGLINKCLPNENSAYTSYSVDFSVEENFARFIAALEARVSKVYTINDTLPVPTKDGYEFLGWYVGDEKVETVSANCTLTAKWRDTSILSYTISYDVAEGTLPEGAVTEFEHGQAVTLPVPTKEGYKFLGWYEGETLVEVITNKNYELVAKWELITNRNITYVLDGGQLPEGAPTEYLIGVGVATLPTPTRGGYEFKGWFTDEACTEAITSIGTDANQDVKLYASWEKLAVPAKELKVDANDANAYATYEEAEAAAIDGDTIIIAAGTYTTITITKSVNVYGANHSVNPNQATRTDETVFTGNVVIAADNVTVDGIKITGDGRIKGSLNGVKNPVVTNIVIQDSTTNPTSGDSATAPLEFYTYLEGAVFENVTISNVKQTDTTNGRPMILFAAQVDGITIKNSSFVVTRKNYNDAIKFQTGDSDAHTAAWGVKGEVLISGCHFENFAQYVIWVSDYQEGTYEFINNTFKNNGQTASSHCTVRMGVYSGEASGLTPCNFAYNTVDNSYSLFRADVNANRTADTQPLTINYNKLLNCKATNWVDNRNAYPADATKNYYSVAPVASSFLNATYDPYYANEEDVPAYVDKENSYKINYELNGAELPQDAPEYYSAETGLASLPVPTKAAHIFMGWELDGEIITSIEIGYTGEITLVAQWREDALYVGEGDADYIYSTLAAALAAAEAGDKIILMAGEYDEAVTINKANITIAGPNQGINAVNGTRVAEAIIKNVISVDPAATGLMIDGLAFTAGGRVVATATSATYDGFTFQNNKVYDTNESATDWVVNRYVMDAVVEFRLKSGGKNKNFEFYNNSFVNCDAVNIMVNRPHNLTVDGNLFKNFSQDAFRIEGGYTNGLHAFTNNVFEVENKGDAHNGIFFYSLSGGDELAVVVLQNNVFRNLGMADSSKFTGALSANFYQEKGLKWEITYNVFENCYNYMWLRNNGASASNWSSIIENNQFLGLPTDFYYGTYTGSDTETTNPHLNVFGANYYEDNDGKVITNMDDIKHLFFHTSTIGTALTAKPGEQEVERYEFFTISYELNGGTTRDSFVYNYSTANTEPITLPTLTKSNHQFNGWLLNGELVTEIPANSRGNLELVADFTVLEGEVYEITFVANQENAIWPSRGAYDRFEIYDALWADLYEWAKLNGETRSFEDYKTATQATIDSYADIKLRNTNLGNYADDTGSTEYFLNTPKYFQKWSEFFAIFRDAMLAVNSNQNFYTDTYATMVRLSQFLNWTSTGEGYFSGYLAQMCAAAKIPQEIPTDYRGGQVVQLPQLSLENGLEFLGWYDNAEFTGSLITAIESTDTGAKTFYAKWAEEVKATEVVINKVNELLLFKTHQLVWTINPDNTTDKSVDFFSSNEDVATINTKGLITAVGMGTTTITMRVYGNRELDVVFELTVYVDDYIDGSYYSNSYVEKEDELQLNATVIYKDGTTAKPLWTSLTPEIATVDENGVVTGLKAGIAKIVATDPKNETLTLEFAVTVLDEMPTGILDLALRANENNVFTRYDMIVGGAYSTDILGSVSKLLANSKLVKDTKYYDKANTTTATYGTMESIEFVTVHYTGNMSNGADAAANANYFANSSSVSIHYTTGNDGVYYLLDESKGAWHAGDSAALNVVGKFQWHATGVKVGANDPKWPEWSISTDFYYEINGQKTSIKMPTPWNYNSRNTDHILNADGTISSQPDYGQAGFQNRDPESFINKIGLPFTIVDGEYYMGTTWWAYSQVYEGRIVSTGGNRNSIGIESCVDINSDLWWTWQKTAQLVADILDRNNLDITRVGGHHFFDGKNCPQPMLENDCEIWWHFIGLIETEYELLTEYEGYEVSITSDSNLVDDYGRIVKQPDETTCVTYTITFSNGTDTQSITLSSMIKGLYVDR